MIDVAYSADEGDQQTFALDYDALIVDWMLPGKNGLTLCRDLRLRGVQTPILMLAARDVH